MIRKVKDGNEIVLNSDKKIENLKDLSEVKVKWFIKKGDACPMYTAKG